MLQITFRNRKIQANNRPLADLSVSDSLTQNLSKLHHIKVDIANTEYTIGTKPTNI